MDADIQTGKLTEWMNADPSIIKGYTIKVVHLNQHLGIKITLEEGASMFKNRNPNYEYEWRNERSV